MSAMPPSISDVARLAGVSPSAVSFALNGKEGKVSESTRARIQSAADLVGYRPNHAARSLKTGRSGIIGMQVSGIGPGVLMPTTSLSSYFVDVMNAAANEALRSGILLVVAPDSAVDESLRGLPFDGGVVLDPLGTETLAAALRLRNRPIVTIGRAPRSYGAAATIDGDYVGTTRVSLDHLLEQGYTRPAMLVAKGKASWTNDVSRTYRQWCKASSVEPILLPLRSPTYPESVAVTTAALSARRRPDSIVAAADQVALGVLHSADKLGISVPDQLGVVALAGVSRSLALDIAHPKLTIANLHASEIGVKAIRMLLTILDGEPSPASRPELASFSLDLGASTDRRHLGWR